LELKHVTQWRRKIADAHVNQVKAHIAAQNDLRAQQLLEPVKDHLQSILDAHGIGDADIDEEAITRILQDGLRSWEGMATEHSERQLQDREYPHVKPVRRVLRPGTQKASGKQPVGVEEELHCYDVPIDKQLQLWWRSRPEVYHKMKAYMQAKAEQVAAIKQQLGLEENADWCVDDVYTSINGLQHPQLGKGDWIGFMFYADGIDCVNPIGLWAGKHKVVVMLAECLALPPAERLRTSNLLVCTVALEKHCKGAGYTSVVGGDTFDPNCSSYGGAMRRLHNGITVHLPGGEKEVVHGGHWSFKADNPQANNLVGTKESLGQTTEQICKQCMATNDNMRRLDLSKSYLTGSPPCLIRTTAVHKQQVLQPFEHSPLVIPVCIGATSDEHPKQGSTGEDGKRVWPAIEGRQSYTCEPLLP
jgi:hypothetical protein